MSGWMWRAPKLMTGSGAAASTTRARPSPSRSTGRASRGTPSRTARTGGSGPGSAGRSPSGSIRSPSSSASSCVSAGSAVGQDVAEEVLRLVDPAQHRVLPGEDLHRHDGVEALALEDAVGPREVDVGRIAGQDLVRGSSALEAHRSGSAPRCRARVDARRRRGRPGPSVAASVPYGSPRLVWSTGGRRLAAAADPAGHHARAPAATPVPAQPADVDEAPRSSAARSSRTRLTTRPLTDRLRRRPRRRGRRVRGGDRGAGRSPSRERVARRGEVGVGRLPHIPSIMIGSPGRPAGAGRPPA